MCEMMKRERIQPSYPRLTSRTANNRLYFKPVLRGLPIQWGNNVPVDSDIYSVMVPLLLIIVAIQIFFPYLSKVFKRNESTILVAIKDEVHQCLLCRKIQVTGNVSPNEYTQYIFNIYCYAHYIVILYLYCIVQKFYFYDSKHQIRY